MLSWSPEGMHVSGGVGAGVVVGTEVGVGAGVESDVGPGVWVSRRTVAVASAPKGKIMGGAVAVGVGTDVGVGLNVGVAGSALVQAARANAVRAKRPDQRDHLRMRQTLCEGWAMSPRGVMLPRVVKP